MAEIEKDSKEPNSTSQEQIYTREKWAHKIEFVLSGISFAVGLGNVWRFPYLCYKNGGGGDTFICSPIKASNDNSDGLRWLDKSNRFEYAAMKFDRAFFIPYFVCLITGGIPIFLLEVGLGQLTSEGGIMAWNICPPFKGIGYATTVVCFLLNIYYIVILAWTFHYFCNSFTTKLPWSSCGNWWNTDNCFIPNSTTGDATNPKRVDSVVEYWENRVLGISKGIDEPGGIQWELALSLLIVWILTYFCVWKGIKIAGKVVYFTSIFPYFMLTALFIRGVTLDGAYEGVIFYIKPDFSKVLEAQVWIDAGTQIFFSYAIALGCMIALGSFNQKNNNFIKDCAFIAFANSGTSLFAGFAIFSVLGYMAKEQGVPIAQVAESGPGLVFIAYPKAVAQMPWSSMWSILFFFMIMLLGTGSQFVGVEGFITAVIDIFPRYFRVKNRKEKFIAFVCFFSYIIGLTMGGMYVFQIFDFYAASGVVLLTICFSECICVGYFYGADKFYEDIKRMVGFRLTPWFKYCWLYFAPIVTLGILIFSIPASLSLTYNRVYKYPLWALMIGWCMALVPIILIPTYFLWYIFSKSTKNIFQERRNILRFWKRKPNTHEETAL